MKKVQGIVRWFDNKSGEGMVRVGEKSIYCHWSAIVKGLETGLEYPHKADHVDNKQVWTVLFSGQKVLVEVFEDSHYTQIDGVYQYET